MPRRSGLGLNMDTAASSGSGRQVLHRAAGVAHKAVTCGGRHRLLIRRLARTDVLRTQGAIQQRVKGQRHFFCRFSGP